MDKELLEILKSIQEDIAGIKSSQNDTAKKLDTIETKLDHVFEQTVDLTEFRMDVITKLDNIQNDLSTVEVVTSKNWNDIAKLKIVK